VVLAAFDHLHVVDAGELGVGLAGVWALSAARTGVVRRGLPRVRLTSLTPGIVGREGCTDAQEVPAGVQA
jgi:hypothetical protein